MKSAIFLFLVMILASGLFQRGQMAVAYAESISLSVDPPIMRINATPPAQVLSPLTIENQGNSSINLSIQFKPFVPSDTQDGQIEYVKESDANLADPLFFQRVSVLDESGQALNDITLAPKEQKKLSFSINIPKDSPSSDYYFSIIFLSGKTSQDSISSSESVSGIASNVLLSIGQGKVSGEITEFSAPIFMEKGSVPFTVRVKNTSNHFISPKGEILVKNLFAQTIGRVDLGEVNILSQSIRSIPSSDFSSSTANWPEKIILGPYKATLSITLSDTGPIFRRSILFFVFPVKTLAVILIGTLILAYITLKVRSKA